MICQKEGQIPILSLHGWPMTSEKFSAISFPKENVVLKSACAFHRCTNILADTTPIPEEEYIISF